MNAAAVFAPEKVYKCSGSVAFNCVPKLQFAAATRTRLTDAGRLHGVPPRLREVRRRNQIVPMKIPDIASRSELQKHDRGTVIVKG